MATEPTPAARAAALIEAAVSEPHTLESLATNVGMSPSGLRRAFAAKFGMSPAAYLRAVRAGAMREHLRSGNGVSEAGYAAGFGSDRAIWEHGSRALGMAPSRYRKGGAGLEIAWSSAASPVGEIVVGATHVGICCVLFLDGADPTTLLAEEFPAAELSHDPDALRPHVDRIIALMRGDQTGDVPLDLVGTPFQREVWAELRRIPEGETATYAQIAARIGSTSAVRAVAGACAANHAAVVVPCHRVVRTDGGLGGYRWGIERKKQLLIRETRP